MLELSWNKITSAFLILFFKVLENRLLASDKWLFCMFWKGEEVQGWLATPEWVWCLWDIKQMTTAKWLPKAANSWQRESKAHSCVQEEAWWFGSQTVTLIQGGSWPSYWFRESLLSDSFHCQHDVFALLAGIGDSKWDSAAPEVNFSWRSHIKVAGGIPGSGRKMVIAALISVVE